MELLHVNWHKTVVTLQVDMHMNRNRGVIDSLLADSSIGGGGGGERVRNSYVVLF